MRRRGGRRNGNRRGGRRGGGRQLGGVGYSLRRNPVYSLTHSLSEGTFRMRDSLTISSSAAGNVRQIISRSITQFTESKSLMSLYTTVRLVAFECSITPAPTFFDTFGGTNTSPGWFVIGTNPVTTVTPPTLSNEIAAQSDSREFYMRARVTPFQFRSMISRSGYLPTAFASETSYVFAGSPGTILIGNVLSNTEAASVDILYIIITGIYQLSGRTTA